MEMTFAATNPEWTRKQLSFDPLDYEFPHDALKFRNQAARRLRKDGWHVISWTLPNQLSKYSGLGQPDGRIRNVYMIDATKHESE